MAQITEKELSALGDLMTMESVLGAKCCALATETDDAELRDIYTQMAGRHQRHFDQLYGNLK
ncbi:MAG: hypothetical protein E7590_08060 [Ruminococcaceae bacterium]|nr:hypothetical protein [Oscillospiraceae bacterium]